jgi:hypothetical protein
MTDRCEATAPATEFCQVETRCDLTTGHDGPHTAQLGVSSQRVWQDVTFPINYKEDEKRND